MLRRGADRAGEDGVPDTDMFQTFARYNEWMNEKVYAVCAGIDDAERKRDRGAFFKSIHGTLNHLLFGDRAWMGRFTGRKYEIAPIGVDLYDDFSELRADRGPHRGMAWRDPHLDQRRRRAHAHPSAPAAGQPAVQPSDPSSRPADHAFVSDGLRRRPDRPALDGRPVGALFARAAAAHTPTESPARRR
jgi:hypothetical protein